MAAINKDIDDFIKWAAPRLAYIASSDDTLEKIAGAGLRTAAMKAFDAFGLAKGRAAKAGFTDVADYFAKNPKTRDKMLFDRRMADLGKQYKFQAKDVNGQMDELQRVFNLEKSNLTPAGETPFKFGSSLGKFVANRPLIAGSTLVGIPAFLSYNAGHSNGYDAGATEGLNNGLYNGMMRGINMASSYGANSLSNTGIMDRLSYLFTGNPDSLNYPQTQDLASMLNRYMSANGNAMF